MQTILDYSERNIIAMQKSLYYKGLNMYNKKPNYLKSERNIKVFRKNVVNMLKIIIVKLI